jgi:hypothetical protein
MQWDCRLSTGLPPQQPTMSAVKPEGGPAGSVKPGQESCVRSSGIITLSVQRPSDISGRSPPQTRPQWSITWGHQCSETTLTGESRFHISTPCGDWTRVPHDGKQMGGPLAQWYYVWLQWDCRLSTTQTFLKKTFKLSNKNFFSLLNPFQHV